MLDPSPRSRPFARQHGPLASPSAGKSLSAGRCPSGQCLPCSGLPSGDSGAREAVLTRPWRDGMPREKITRSAFSLLELMIVLTMMVAIGAVAWPSLRRPMADSSVQQAANQLRAQIADCRQLAAIEGQPRLMRFESGVTSVGRGPWNDLMAQQLADADSTGGATRAIGDAQDNQDADAWELPVDIVVDEVQLDKRSYVEADESSPLTDTGDQVESKWYLPFLPSGQTRDAVIVLRDCVTGSRVALEIEAVTGLMRTQKLTAAKPGDALEVASTPANHLTSERSATPLNSQPGGQVYSR